MTRSRLKHKFHNNPSDINKCRYKQQRNYCVNLTRRAKKIYYSNININNVIDNKKFWDTIKPCFSDKHFSKKKITLIENDTIITEDLRIAETMNTYFSICVNKNSQQVGHEIEYVLDVTQIIAKT